MKRVCLCKLLGKGHVHHRGRNHALFITLLSNYMMIFFSFAKEEVIIELL